jgi:adenine-specific DNA-methyltransferase
LFFPIFVDPEIPKILDIGEPLPLDQTPDLRNLSDGKVAWPLRKDGALGNWRVSPPTLRKLLRDGLVRLGGFDKVRETWTVLYLGEKAQKEIESGTIQIIGRNPTTGEVDVEYAETQQRNIKTVWHRGVHDAGNYGSSLLRSILGEGGKFSFPKSIYATRDALAAVVRDRRNAFVVDFFAGSGTTLNAIALLNATDGGHRRCILVTNNEVSGEDAAALAGQGFQPGDEVWETKGICRSVTWPRSKFTILGRRDDGTSLPGEYLTGKTLERQRPRRVTQIGFVDTGTLDRPARKKQLVALLDGIPQTLVTDPCPFIVSEDHKASVLFDEGAAEDWLAALEGQDHITDLYIVTPDRKRFDAIKADVQDLLGPILVPEEEKRPLAAGFPANLAYFKLDFLDRDRVALKRAFSEILPLLWLKAGSIGPRPELPRGEPEPAFFAPPANPFAVLLDEGSLKALLGVLAGRAGLRCLFIVTDSEDAFKELSAEAMGTLRSDSPDLSTVQLYRDYLENFLINRDRIDAVGTGGAG